MMKPFLLLASMGLLMAPIEGVTRPAESTSGNLVYCARKDAIFPVAPRRGRSSPQKASIAIIGVDHGPSLFVTDRFSPAHIRASLEALKPDAVAVESNPDWFKQGRYYRLTYEAQDLSVPWAKSRGIPVCGIDWVGTLSPLDGGVVKQYRKERENSVPGTDLDPAAYSYGLASWSELPAPSGEDTPSFPIQKGEQFSFHLLNSPEYGERWLKWIDGGKRFNQLYMQERDDHIVAHIATVADAHPGGRLAIIIGAAHKADLERKLRAKGYSIVDLAMVERRFPARDGPRMDALLTSSDLAAMLAAAWDGPQELSRERAERLLAQLGAAATTDRNARIWHAYFQARRQMLNGDHAAARTALLELAPPGQSVRFPYQGWQWRQYLTVQQAALLELGRIADLQGQREEALGHYRRLLEMLPMQEYAEDYFSNYFPLATARNAVTALLQKPYAIRQQKDALSSAP